MEETPAQEAVEEMKEEQPAEKKQWKQVVKKLEVRWQEKQRRLEALLEGKERLTPEENQYKLLVPTHLAEKLSEGDKLQTIIDQVQEEDPDAYITLQVSQETEVEIPAEKTATATTAETTTTTTTAETTTATGKEETEAKTEETTATATTAETTTTTTTAETTTA